MPQKQVTKASSYHRKAMSASFKRKGRECFFCGEGRVEWIKMIIFACAKAQLLFNPLKFNDYDEH